MSRVSSFYLDWVAGFNIPPLKLKLPPNTAAVVIVMIVATIAYIATRIRHRHRYSDKKHPTSRKLTSVDAVDDVDQQARLPREAYNMTLPEKGKGTEIIRGGGHDQDVRVMLDNETEDSEATSHIESLRAKIAGQARELEVLRRGLRRMDGEARKKGIEILVERIQFADALGRLKTQVKLQEAEIRRLQEKERQNEVDRANVMRENEGGPPQYHAIEG